MKKVFVSSVMKGFEAERHAARKAIESLRLTPVMAEDFGAKPFSSEVACLDGVRSSDIFVLILAPRYGFVTPSGKSVTEEEFLEARSRGLHVLPFVSKGVLEPKQQEFFQRIGDYGTGYFASFFDNPHDLQTEVTKALHDLTSQPGVATMPPAAAASRMHELLGVRNQTQVPLLSAAIFPTRAGEEYISPLDMNTEAFKNGFAQQAMFGPAALFDPKLGFQPAEGREHVRLQQSDPRGRWLTAAELHADGTVFLQASVSDPNDQLSALSLMRVFVIDEDAVRLRLARFFSFANASFATMKSSPLITSVYASVGMSGIANKFLGKTANHDPRRGMQMPMSQIDDPLIVPTTPLMVSRGELGNGEVLAERYLGLLLQAFRASDREFTANKLGW